MNFNMLITIKNCNNPEELWSKINRYAQSMVADVGENTFITCVGRYEDIQFVIAQSMFHGDCEISITQKE